MDQEAIDFNLLAQNIKLWGKALGFQQIGITDTDLNSAGKRLTEWLEKKFHGDMAYMATYGEKRYRPPALVPGTIRIISARIDYLPPAKSAATILQDHNKAFVSRYATGRDYHKLVRKRLQQLAYKINDVVGDFQYRAFADSAPVMEKPIAEKAGLGWIGKSTNLINKKAGSWFFLGTLYTNLPLPVDEPQQKSHCGTCSACIDVCPTKAIVGPYQLDARRCISNLTIENRGTIPIEFRPLIGNRIYGCDDCQLVCPWNRFADFTEEKDFHPRHQLDNASLISLFNWTESEFNEKTKGSAIRRIGYEGWLRNIAVAMGNAMPNADIEKALREKLSYPSELVREHIQWALSGL